MESYFQIYTSIYLYVEYYLSSKFMRMQKKNFLIANKINN